MQRCNAPFDRIAGGLRISAALLNSRRAVSA